MPGELASGGASPARKYFLDWLRVIAFALLIVFHVGCLYATWEYNLKAPRPAPEVDWALSTFSPWRMALLFLISGVASRFLIDKLGAPGFAADRVRRLVPVILFGMFVVIPPQIYVELIAKGLTTASYLGVWLSYLRADQTLAQPIGRPFPTWDHLWFVVYLLVYTLALALFARRRDSRAASTLPLWIVLIAPPIALVLANLIIEHIAPVTHALVDDWGSHLKWIAMFATGVICARHEQFWRFLERRRHALLAIALMFLALQSACRAYWLTGEMDPVWDGVAWSIATGLFAWSAICALCGYGAAHLNAPSPLLSHLNEAILPVYVLHQPVLLIGAFFIFPLEAPLAIEALAILAVTLVGSFALYELVIRPFNPIRFLFGMKPRPAERAQLEAAPG